MVSFDDVEPHVTPINVVTHARQIYEGVQQKENEMRRFAAGALLKTYNENWRQGKGIDKKAFMERMTLESMMLYADGTARLCYSVGDLFGGHSIFVHTDDELYFSSVELVG